MGSSRRKHSREFKLEAVRQVVDNGRTVTDVADSLGINRNMLSKWKVQFEADGSVASPGAENQADLVEENRRLKRELAIARQERDILGKATAYFANAKN